MNTPKVPESQDDAAARGASIERRREALRRIGRTGAAAGAASPLAALAGGNNRQWVADKYRTKKVQASISGAGSVLLSAAPGQEVFGKPCSYFASSSNLPANCRDDKAFSNYFNCSGMRDSNGRSMSSGQCLFKKRITELCTTYPNSPETTWITAYCNASLLYASSKYPYSSGEVQNFWSADAQTKSSAYSFFQSWMMSG